MCTLTGEISSLKLCDQVFEKHIQAAVDEKRSIVAIEHLLIEMANNFYTHGEILLNLK